MIGIVIACHGRLADALWSTVSQVMSGPVPAVVTLTVGEGDDLDSFRERMSAAISEVDTTGEVLVLTDMFGGTPSNVALSMHDVGRVEILTGANLPMVLRAVQACRSEDATLESVASVTCEAGRGAIAVASQVLAQVGSK